MSALSEHATTGCSVVLLQLHSYFLGAYGWGSVRGVSEELVLVLIHYVLDVRHSFYVFSSILVLESRWFIVNVMGVLVECLGIATFKVHFFSSWS